MLQFTFKTKNCMIEKINMLRLRDLLARPDGLKGY